MEDKIEYIPVSVFLIMRSFYVQKSWQDINENPSDPGCHCMRLLRSEMEEHSQREEKADR